ncbi:MAG TPA: helix-hairpin-helix domain-containing protein [Saprospiraceae bacterium]|nr:helix-hairpin-helix domain-containing protein [Saprospiraceae bacterium]
MEQFDFNAFFQQLSNSESLIFIAFCLGAFLIGLLFGVALRGGKIRRLKKELKKKEEQISEQNRQLNEQAEIITQKEADLKKSAYDLNQIRLAADRYEQENNDLNKEVLSLRNALDQREQMGTTLDASDEALQERIRQLEAENKALRDASPGENVDAAKVKALQQQVEYLKSRNEELQQELDGPRSGNATQDTNRVQALQEQIDYLKKENARLREGSTEGQSTTGNEDLRLPTDRLAAFEARLNQLETENATLKSSIAQLNSRSANTATFEPDDQSPSVVEPDADLILQPKSDLFKTDRELLLDQSRDDLNQIEGIGPFIEKKLNDIGVYSFEQIAEWAPEDIITVTQQLNYFEGRIEKDDWVGQAKKFRDNPDLVASTTTSPGEEEDPQKSLNVVEGIGPKIAAILRKAGIDSLETLAQTDPADIEQILEQADPRYQMHDPSTWPAQARLAANGNWEVLKDYQEELKGGRDID